MWIIWGCALGPLEASALGGRNVNKAGSFKAKAKAKAKSLKAKAKARSLKAKTRDQG